MRGGYGIFYDWYDSALYEQTIRVDGNHQVDVIVQNPAFPVIDGGGTRLPASVIRSASLDQPIIQQASIGLERPLAAWADFRTDYMWTRGSNTLRSVNVNAPVNGVRPDPAVGNITEIQSSGKRASDRFTVALNARYIPRRILGMVMYQFTNARNFADFADGAAVEQHQSRCGLGTVGAGRAASHLLQLQHAARATACAWASTCRARRRCRTTSPPASTTTATRCSTIVPPASAATARAARRSGPRTSA